MKITQEYLDNILVLSPRGEITIQTIDNIRKKISPFIERAEKYLLIDMLEVKYIDSAGLSLLVETHKSIQKGNKMLLLASVNENIGKVLQMTRLSDLLKIYPTRESALSDIQ